MANNKGVILQFKLHAWRVFDVPNVSPNWELTAVSFSTGNDIWAVGVDYSNGTRQGIILRNQKGTWTIFPPPFVSVDWALYDLSFAGSKEGWAVGFDYANHRGVLLHVKSGVWTFLVPPDVGLNWGLYGVHMINSTQGWAVGVDLTNKRGVLLEYTKDPEDKNRTKRNIWQVYLPPQIDADWGLSSVFFPSVAEGWAVGTNHTEKRGMILHYVRPRWDEVLPSLVSSDFEFNFATFPSSTTGWISGVDHTNKKGVLIQQEDRVWIDSPVPVISRDWKLGNVRFAGSDQIWAFGTDHQNKKGVILRYSANAKESVSTPTKPNGPTTIAPNASSIFYTGDSISSLDHSVQYLIDWGDGTDSGWLPVGTVGASKKWATPGTYQIKAQARCDTDTSVVSKWSSDFTVTVADNPTPIRLLSPPNGTPNTACSLYSLPTFTWKADSSSFTGYELQFSATASFDLFIGSTKISTTSEQVDYNLWKRVLAAPGIHASGSSKPLAVGGPVFWRVVGTRTDKSLVISDTFSVEIANPQPVGNPTITGTSKSSIPVLSWENNCNIKFRVWFGNNINFTHQTSLSYNIKDPTQNGGVFTESLTSTNWTAVQNVTGRITGSTVYWYVEAWDGTDRRVLTQPPQSFVIED
jgi:hypothetical protein